MALENTARTRMCIRLKKMKARWVIITLESKVFGRIG